MKSWTCLAKERTCLAKERTNNWTTTAPSLHIKKIMVCQDYRTQHTQIVIWCFLQNSLESRSLYLRHPHIQSLSADVGVSGCQLLLRKKWEMVYFLLPPTFRWEGRFWAEWSLWAQCLRYRDGGNSDSCSFEMVVGCKYYQSIHGDWFSVSTA